MLKYFCFHDANRCMYDANVDIAVWLLSVAGSDGGGIGVDCGDEDDMEQRAITAKG